MSEHEYHQPIEGRYKLDETICEHGRMFLRNLSEVEGIAPLPELSFLPSSRLFVCVPAYCELGNVERFFLSWNAQELPIGVTAEVIILVNNKVSASDAVVRENQQYIEQLNAYIAAHPSDIIQFHIIDRSARGQEIPDSVPFGVIRNILTAPVVSKAVEHQQNGTIFMTDADCFPDKHTLAELYRVHTTTPVPYYGSFELKLEFAEDVSDADREQLKRIYILNDTHEILLDYLTTGEWIEPEILCGGDTFYTIEQFLRSGGYPRQGEIGEDMAINAKLRQDASAVPVYIDAAAITGIERLDTRSLVLSDSGKMSEMKAAGYVLQYDAITIGRHAQLRQWLLDCVAHQVPFQEGVARLAVITGSFGDFDINALGTLIQSQGEKIDPSHYSEDEYYHVFEGAVHALYGQRTYSLVEVTASLADAIDKILGKDSYFVKLREEILSQNPKVSLDDASHLALYQFTRQQGKVGGVNISLGL